ncbi:Annexin repeat [Aphelenchoides avenae]|nr:Annexin repeat [Aphelenchus avenae]
MHGPTVKPALDFDASADAKHLHHVLSSHVSGKEEAVASLLCSRSNGQRQEIAQRYTETTKHNLAEDISAAFKGEFKDLMVELCLPSDEFYATEFHRAIKDRRVNVIAEIFGSLSCPQLMAVKQAYQRLFHTCLKEEILSHASIRKLSIFVLLSLTHRDDSTRVDEQKLKKDLTLLQNLLNADERMQHKLEVFRQMLAIGSYAQLRALFDAYEKSAVSSLEDLIRKAFPEDDNVQALIALARTIHHPRSTFATNLRHYYDKDVKWFGVSNSQRDVIRTVVGRSEIDLDDVLEKYKSLYGSTFLAESNDALDGNYTTALAVLAGSV